MATHSALLRTNLDRIGIGSRVCSFLGYGPLYHIESLGDLVQRSADELSDIANIGQGTIDHIRQCLAAFSKLHGQQFKLKGD